MSNDMPVEQSPAEMFILLDCDTVRLQLPPLPISGILEPLRIHLDFAAGMVDEILQRLSVLRAQMLPGPPRKPGRGLVSLYPESDRWCSVNILPLSVA